MLQLFCRAKEHLIASSFYSQMDWFCCPCFHCYSYYFCSEVYEMWSTNLCAGKWQVEKISRSYAGGTKNEKSLRAQAGSSFQQCLFYDFVARLHSEKWRKKEKRDKHCWMISEWYPIFSMSMKAMTSSLQSNGQQRYLPTELLGTRLRDWFLGKTRQSLSRAAYSSMW